MNILCRLGLHSWKPVARVSPFYIRYMDLVLSDEAANAGINPAFMASIIAPLKYDQVGHQCRRCGKRVRL